ncbi:hypothetical protein RM844_01165 [Streptomyces sp. DSM 44915]|uniref:Uncharacterized protein n=1 Tax=Streptomyces chisholmiae TaxID=3075540 RepID=A0ABU2JIZ8_9ACTN|nr:hypothetical protein [Streptomyces sp. DSM 44915]MDT0264892.1 hypothetical protein [Streptomyces sp. DSM 44915]
MGLVQLVHRERSTMGRALRALDERLLAGGRRTALENAWSAVREDQERAAAHREAERALRAVDGGNPPPARPTTRV